MRYPSRGFYSQDQNGQIIQAATVTAMLAGTVTPAQFYLAQAGGAAVYSMTSDAITGFFQFWVDTADYPNTQKFDIYTNCAITPNVSYQQSVLYNEMIFPLYPIDPSISYATMSTAGVIEIATQVQVDAGIDPYCAVTPATLAGSSIVTGPATSSTGHLAIFADATGKVIADSGGTIPAILGDVVGPLTSTSSAIAIFADASGELLADSGISFPIPVASGGTGAATASGARTNLGLSLPLAVVSGGTGAASAGDALTNLGVSLPIAVASGGTGATTAAGAKSNLGITAGTTYKGGIDCHLNPNYPAASSGDEYMVTVAGKIGGASGTSVAIQAVLICHHDGTASGDQATVGSYWDVYAPTTGVTGPGSSTAHNIAGFADVSGGVLEDSGVGFPVPVNKGGTAAATAAAARASLLPSFTGKAYYGMGVNAGETDAEWQQTPKSIMTAQGDTVYASAANTIARLAKGTAYQTLGMNAGATAPVWAASATSTLTTAGDVLYASSAYTLARLAKGTAYQTLGMNAGATAPVWQASPNSLLTAQGDILYASAANTLAKLAAGTSGQFLKTQGAGANPVWGTPTLTPTAGAGDYLFCPPCEIGVANSGTYAKTTELKLSEGGTFRTRLTLFSNVPGSDFYARIYKNGVAFGTARHHTGASTEVYTEDLAFAVGDLLQIYSHYTTSNIYSYTTITVYTNGYGYLYNYGG